MLREYKQIKSANVPELLSRGAAIVDVRRPEEWQLTGTVAESILLTFFDQEGNCNPEKWLQQLNQKVTGDVPLVLI